MSGASIPYHLRPHKAVDRRIFLDLLTRLERWRPMNNHVYLSMGAYPLEDHKLVHRNLGITRLIAFDMEAEVVSRQIFNKPVSSCHCIEMMSGELASNLDGVLDKCEFGDPNGVIVWLDYTSPKAIGEQIREFESLLNSLSAGDVVRVTVNAHPHELIEVSNGTPTTIEDKRKKQLHTLRGRIKDYLPSDVNENHMTAEGLPLVLSRAFAKAALNAFQVSSPYAFKPLLIVRYADGLQMLSITGVVVEKLEENELIMRLGMDAWPFSSSDWTDIHNLVVPDLTLRERLFLEREVVSKTPDEIIADLGFTAAGDIPISDFIESYKNYYRFYPTLLTSEV